MRSTAIVRPLRSWVALRSMRFRVAAASAAISALRRDTCLRRRSGVDGAGGARRAAASGSNRRSRSPPRPRSPSRTGLSRVERSRPALARRALRSSALGSVGVGASRAISGASKSAWASLASLTPSWSRSTRVRTSAASPSARSPSSNGPKETRIRRLTASPRCSSTFLISRFFPSRRPNVIQTFEPCSRSSLASMPR